ncbi:MAG TPA: hypothetical protein EYN67_14865 [Flavobacteriales bacterium]|nr:hypothetical protein [Methylococcaceae bacterium]HHZ96792.1 hypothetical protein [Flavobacteriales bacterium]
MAGGFRPIQDRSGHPYIGKVETYAVDATHSTLLSVGDLVTETGNLDASTGISEVDASSAAGLITGVIVGIDFNMSNLEQKGLAASTAGTVKVATDKDMLLEAETSGGTFAVTDVSGNLDIVATAATQTGGLVNSNMTINATGAASSGTAQVRIVGVKDSGSITYPAPIGTTLICRINESTNDAVGV